MSSRELSGSKRVIEREIVKRINEDVVGGEEGAVGRKGNDCRRE